MNTWLNELWNVEFGLILFNFFLVENIHQVNLPQFVSKHKQEIKKAVYNFVNWHPSVCGKNRDFGDLLLPKTENLFRQIYSSVHLSNRHNTIKSFLTCWIYSQKNQFVNILIHELCVLFVVTILFKYLFYHITRK